MLEVLGLVPRTRSPRQALESSMRRDTLGPVREAGVRHRRYARLSLAAPASSRARCSGCCIKSPQEGVLPSPRGGLETGSLIDMSIVNFAAATLCRCLCWPQLPEGEKQC